MTQEADSTLVLFQTTLQELWIWGGLAPLFSDAPRACWCAHRLSRAPVFWEVSLGADVCQCTAELRREFMAVQPQAP